MDKSVILNFFQGDYARFYSALIPDLKKSTGNELKAICPFHDDHDPSLSINAHSGLFKCFACGASGSIFDFYGRRNGMDPRHDLPKIILAIADQFGIHNGNGPVQTANTKSKIVARYGYRDQSGQVAYQIERLEPKSFRIKRSDGNGGWIYGQGDVEIIPYRFPDVIKSDEIIIVEGEKDADNLSALGFTATTNPFGAGKWPGHFGEHFKGKNIIIIPDNDAPGRDHMKKVIVNLRDHAASIKYLELPGLLDKGDVSDFIAKFPIKDDAAERLAVMIDGAPIIEDSSNFIETAVLNHTENAGPDSLVFPESIMSGAAGDFAKTYSTYLEPPAHFFYISYLTCLGSILSDRLTINSELQPEPRIYALILGESADDRKSTVLNKATGFFRGSDHDFSVCHGIGSAEGLQEKLCETNKTVLCLDEFKAFVSKSKIESSVLLPCVTTLFESNHYESRTKKKPLSIDNARLSIIAACTLDTYETIFDQQFLAIGFPNRLFLVPGTGKRRFSIPPRIPSHDLYILYQKLNRIVMHVGNNMELPIDEDARDLFHHWYMELPQSVHTKRLDTYALRFMTVMTVNDLKSTVDLAIMEKVIALCDWQYRVRRRFDPIDADSTMARTEEKIRRILESGPKNKREIERAVHANRIGNWIFETSLKNLLKADQIKLEKGAKTYVKI